MAPGRASGEEFTSILGLSNGDLSFGTLNFGGGDEVVSTIITDDIPNFSSGTWGTNCMVREKI